MTASDGGHTTFVQIAARRSTGGPEEAWFLLPQPAFMFGCQPAPNQPCIVGTQVGAPVPLSPDAGVALKRSHQLGGDLVAMLEARGLGAANTLVARCSPTGVGEPLVFSGSMPGPIGSDGQTLLSVGALPDGGLATAVLDAQTLTWVAQPDIETAYVWSLDAPLAIAGFGPRVMVSGTNAANHPAIFNDGITGWLENGLDTTAVGTYRSPQLAMSQGPAGVNDVMGWMLGLEDVVVGGIPEQHLRVWSVQSGAPPFIVADGTVGTDSITSYDYAYRQPMGVVAYVVAGQLRVAVQYDNASQADRATLPGAHADGVMNVDPACEAANPTVAVVEDFLYVAWQERCVGGNWKVAWRALR